MKSLGTFIAFIRLLLGLRSHRISYKPFYRHVQTRISTFSVFKTNTITFARIQRCEVVIAVFVRSKIVPDNRDVER